MNIFDEDWIVKHKENNIFLMTNHRLAFVVWEYSRIKKNISDKAALVHVDTHLDDVPELADSEKILSANTVEELEQIALYKQDSEVDDFQEMDLRHDNFIIPSFLKGTIQDIIYVSNPENLKEIEMKEISMEDIYEAAEGDGSNNYFDHSGNVDNVTLKRCYNYIKGQDKSISRYMGVESFLKESNLFRRNQEKILDIDLDYFNNSLEWKTGELKHEEIIRSVLLGLKNYTEWDLITVALSPGFSGKKEDTIYLLKIFLEVFELESKSFKPWNLKL